MRMLADPYLGWEGGMRPVINFSTPGEFRIWAWGSECATKARQKQLTSLESWILGEGKCKWHVKIFLEFDPGISEFGLWLRGWNEAGD